MVRDCAAGTLDDLTPTAVLRWCAGVDGPRTLANNTIRGRTAVVSALLRWCARSSISAPAAEHLTDQDSPLRQFRPTYGKAQSQNPPRWLTREEAYVQLLAAIPDTPMGRRDAIVLRLGLCGLRAQEIAGLRIGDLRDLDTDHPSLHWTGKRYKPLHIAIGPQTIQALRSYLVEYRQCVGADLDSDLPLVCRRRPGRTANGQPHRLDYGTGLAPGASGRASIWNIVTKAALSAGLGHVAPHDLRRTAAGILHRETGPDGAHLFDLLDIQKVLHHADPVTTMKCYLDPMDTEVIERAAVVLD